MSHSLSFSRYPFIQKTHYSEAVDFIRAMSAGTRGIELVEGSQALESYVLTVQHRMGSVLCSLRSSNQSRMTKTSRSRNTSTANSRSGIYSGSITCDNMDMSPLLSFSFSFAWSLYRWSADFLMTSQILAPAYRQWGLSSILITTWWRNQCFFPHPS